MADMAVVKSVGFLSTLSEAELGALLARARRYAVQKGQQILAQGQDNASLFVVEEGVLHARRITNSRGVFLGRLEQGSCFGELSLFDPGPTAAAVHAASDSVVVEISRSAFDDFIAQHPAAGVEILLRILKDVSGRLRRVDERLSDSVVWGGLLRDKRPSSR